MANEARKILAHQRGLQRELKKFTTVMGTEAVKFFKDSFRNEGFTDTALEKWPKRKREDRNRKKRGILVKTGTLKRSVRVVSKTFNSVTIGSKTPGDYGEVHNEGLRSGRRGARFMMPKRQFMGNSRKLTGILKMKLNRRITSIIR